MPECVWPTGIGDHGNQPPQRLQGKLQRLFHGDESSGAQALETSQEYLLRWLQNCLKPLCNVNVRYVEVKRSSRARSTCEASNGKSDGEHTAARPLERQPDT